jgi:hypothetical protein
MLLSNNLIIDSILTRRFSSSLSPQRMGESFELKVNGLDADGAPIQSGREKKKRRKS